MEYLEFAKSLALESGKIMNKYFRTTMDDKWKKDNTPVTIADLEINSLVIKRVKETFPDHSIIGEEESFLKPDSEFVWSVDPIDGTAPFKAGIPISTFSLALVQDGKPIVGVIFDPFLNQLFFAEKGKGAFLNDKKITVSELTTIENGKYNVESFKRARYDINELKNVLEERKAFALSLCSSAYSGGLVASGMFEGLVFPHTTAHDIAAVKIIVEEAGGKVTDIFGNEQRYDVEINGAVVSNGLVHKELLDLIKESLPKN